MSCDMPAESHGLGIKFENDGHRGSNQGDNCERVLITEEHTLQILKEGCTQNIKRAKGKT